MKVYFIKCSACGEKRYVNLGVLKKRIQKYGSIKAIEKNWKCRKCTQKIKKEQTEQK